MPTLIANLWTPPIWIKSMRERMSTYPSLLNSGVMVPTEEFNRLAAGAGVSVNIPVWKDITDQDDEVQVENTGPTTDNNITSALMVAPVLNRVTKNSGTALASAVSGENPVAEMTGQMAQRRLKQRQKTMLATLRGAFGSLLATGAAAPLKAVRNDYFLETTSGQTSANLIDADKIIDTKALLGELSGDLADGAIWMHSQILAALEKQDIDSFKEGKNSTQAYTIKFYKGIPVYVSDALVRAGTTSGYVYETYIFSPRSVASGEKAQLGDVIDVASLQYDTDKDKNNEIIYDRTRFLMHLNGMKWKGTPAGQSATNAELQTVGNWELAWQSANRVGSVCLRTNG